jgi:hypothetical protein
LSRDFEKMADEICPRQECFHLLSTFLSNGEYERINEESGEW